MNPETGRRLSRGGKQTAMCDRGIVQSHVFRVGIDGTRAGGGVGQHP